MPSAPGETPLPSTRGDQSIHQEDEQQRGQATPEADILPEFVRRAQIIYAGEPHLYWDDYAESRDRIEAGHDPTPPPLRVTVDGYSLPRDDVDHPSTGEGQETSSASHETVPVAGQEQQSRLSELQLGEPWDD